VSNLNPKSPAWARYYANHPEVAVAWGEANGREPSCICSNCDPDGKIRALNTFKPVTPRTAAEPAPLSKIEEGNIRILAAIRQALKGRRELQPSWRDAVTDAITELEMARERTTHLDSISRINSALSCLLGIWFDEDEIDNIYEGFEVES
jgi:hypothetical protein